MDSVVCLLTSDWLTFSTFHVCTVTTGNVCCGQVGVCVSLRRRRRATTPRRAAGASHLVRGRAAARRDLSWETNGGASHAARRQPATPPTCVTSVSFGRPVVMLACGAEPHSRCSRQDCKGVPGQGAALHAISDGRQSAANRREPTRQRAALAAVRRLCNVLPAATNAQTYADVRACHLSAATTGFR